jgi:acetyl esterase/lipase
MTSAPLWNQAAPGALGNEPEDIPSLTTYPAEQPTGAAVIVCPGGGYGHLAPHEGEPFAQFLAKQGITSYVLKYRLGPRYKHPVMLQDVSRAIRTVRANAVAWKLDPKRIGVMGFSAGGHLASSVSVHFDDGDSSAKDPIDRVSSRPDVSILCYPVITMMNDFTHMGSQNNLIGNDAPAELKEKMSSERQVTKNTPPAFIYHRYGDGAVPLENPLQYAAALRKAGVRCELHVYDADGHGQGFAPGAIDADWTERLAKWLKKQGF